jgi:hypothetical protein
MLEKQLKETYSYNPTDGSFIRIKRTSNRFIGEIVGCLDKSTGYIKLGIGLKVYHAHRLAWLYTYGHLPKYIDHINGIKHDNRLCNLRDCTNSENMRNSKIRSDNTSGVKGVSWDITKQVYITQIWLNNKKYTGSFSPSKYDNSKEDALIAATTWVQNMRQELHKDFANNG